MTEERKVQKENVQYANQRFHAAVRDKSHADIEALAIQKLKS
ncbi:hypothetical protein ACKX2L_04570 [Lachnospiraceae bacterium YH-ros2228]|jgi:hypothetical protein